MSEYIEVGQPLQFTDPNTPTRVGEIVENVSDIYNIPTPRLGMQVFVKSEKKTYTITGLKEAVIGGERVPNAKVDTFEAVKSQVEDINNGFAEMREALADGSFVVGVADLANAVKAGAVTFDMLDGKLQLSVSVVDDLETANTLKPLSANQGKVLKNLIDIINGTGEGSTDKKITDAIAALVDSAPENLDTLRELAEWIEDHGMEVERIFEAINANAAAIEHETQRATGVEGTLRMAINTNATDLTESKKNIANQLLVDPTADKVTITGRNEQSMRINFESDIPAATHEKAGVMSAADKEKLDNSTVKSITWNNDNAPSNMNDFTIAGVYDIKGEHTRMDDNLPILNTGGGHTFNARLTVLDSSISGSGNNDDKCITQVLSFSNRLGQGEGYIRTGKGSSLYNLTWEKWSTLQRNVNVGQVYSLYNLIDNGIYSGVYSGTITGPGGGPVDVVETFVLVVINDYAASGKLNLPRHITQLKYAVDAITGQSTVKKRVGTGDDSISWSDWEDIGGGGGDITAVPTEVVIEEIEPNLVSTAIRKTPQVLTDSEKEIARGNIGAAGFSDLNNAIAEAITNTLNTAV